MGTFGCSLKLKCNTHTHAHIYFLSCVHTLYNYLNNFFFYLFFYFPSLSVILPVALSLSLDSLIFSLLPPSTFADLLPNRHRPTSPTCCLVASLAPIHPWCWHISPISPISTYLTDLLLNLLVLLVSFVHFSLFLNLHLGLCVCVCVCVFVYVVVNFALELLKRS